MSLNEKKKLPPSNERNLICYVTLANLVANKCFLKHFTLHAESKMLLKI